MPVIVNKYGHTHVFMDNSRAELVASCETLAFVRLKERLRTESRFKSIPANVGTAFHAGVAEYFETGDIDAAIDAFNASYEEQEIWRELYELSQAKGSIIKAKKYGITKNQEGYPSQYSMGRMLDLLRLWIRRHPLNMFGFNNKTIETERRFCIKMPFNLGNEERPSTTLWFCGQIDIMGRDLKDEIKFIDLKTTGWLKGDQHKQYIRSSQLIGYYYALSCLYGFNPGKKARTSALVIEIPRSPIKNATCKEHKVSRLICDLEHASMPMFGPFKFHTDTILGWRESFVKLGMRYKRLMTHESHLVNLLKQDGLFVKAGYDKGCSECSLINFCDEGRDLKELRKKSTVEDWFPYSIAELQAIIAEESRSRGIYHGV